MNNSEQTRGNETAESEVTQLGETKQYFNMR